MGVAISRAQFLRGDFAGKTGPIRPPWSLPEAGFIDRCTRCGDCISACPQRILQKGRGGFPQVEFSRGECLFCGACVQACTPGVLLEERFQDAASRPWSIRATISEPCLATRGVECRSCGDHCEAGAIRFRLVVGGAAAPLLDQSACTGCGACYGACPVKAIRLGETRVNKEVTGL